jgi:hypothetical protein
MVLGLIFIFSLLNLSPSFAQNVLIVGDSQSAGPFGEQLHLRLKNANLKVHEEAAVGSVAGSWVKGLGHGKTRWDYRSISSDGKSTSRRILRLPPLGLLVENTAPNAIILQFGGNYRPYSVEGIEADFRLALTLIEKSKAKCIVISGPDSAPPHDVPVREKVIPTFQKAIGSRCAFFNSTEVTHYPKDYKKYGGDGFHYNYNSESRQLARDWADKVADWALPQILDH